MSSIDKNTVKTFCEHCDWAHQCWLFRKHLYDENPEQALLRNPYHAYFFDRLEKILQEYWLHEVAKLLDPARQRGFDNLSVDFIFRSGVWKSGVKKKLTELKDKLEAFGVLIKPARNKLLSHKDKDIVLSGVALGAFDEGKDVEFFDALKEYVNEVHLAVVGSPYSFDDLTQSDVGAFMKTFSKGLLRDA